jgi:hypothetical protein
MDCLRSFTFIVDKTENYTTALRFKTWTVGTDNYWLVDDAKTLGNGSKYIVQGFKNINIYKIEITGAVITPLNPPGFAAITENWNLTTAIKGTTSNSVGLIVSSPNPFNIIEFPGLSILQFSKYQRSITFLDPIKSAEYIEIYGFYAEGYGNQSLLSAQIGFFINVTVYYKYEGED